MLKDSRQNQYEGARAAKGLWTEMARRGRGRLLEAGMERPLRPTCKGPWMGCCPSSTFLSSESATLREVNGLTHGSYQVSLWPPANILRKHSLRQNAEATIFASVLRALMATLSQLNERLGYKQGSHERRQPLFSGMSLARAINLARFVCKTRFGDKGLLRIFVAFKEKTR